MSVSLSSFSDEHLVIGLYNHLGQGVALFDGFPIGSTRVVLPLGHLVAGVYFLEVREKEGITVEKVIKVD